ncbi:MAG: hypothetical protein OS112_03280 [Methanoregula sp.]|nr:MAG: hypothetical protein OS112_03280 [Methanoregula sp.]
MGLSESEIVVNDDGTFKASYNPPPPEPAPVINLYIPGITQYAGVPIPGFTPAQYAQIQAMGGNAETLATKAAIAGASADAIIKALNQGTNPTETIDSTTMTDNSTQKGGLAAVTPAGISVQDLITKAGGYGIYLLAGVAVLFLVLVFMAMKGGIKHGNRAMAD